MPNYNPVIRQAARRYGINPKILRAQLKQESGLREGLRSSAGAQDIAQFIPSTARAYGVTLGDNRARDDIFGAAHYMADNLKRTGGDYRAALSIYNSGRPDAYKDPKFAGGQTFNYVRSILADAGGASPVAPGRTAGPTAGPAYRTQTIPGIDNGPLRQQLKLQYLQNSHDPNALLQLAAGLQNAQDTPSTTTRVRVGATARGRARSGGQPTQGGKVTMAPGADRPGVRTHKQVRQFVRQIAGLYGQPLTIGTGTNHSEMTVNGNVSDHWTGWAADIPLTGRALIRAGQDALIAAGMSRKQARQQTGGLFNVHGKQIIFNTHIGGDHTTHLHVGLRGNH